MIKRFTFLLYLFLSISLTAQDSGKWSISPALIGGIFPSYPYSLKEYNPLLIPYLPVQYGNFYGEVRYNYDRNGTWGLYGGTSRAFGAQTTHVVTPQIGVVLGDYQGISVQFYYSLIHPKVEFNLTNNYVKVFNHHPNYYFNWSDLQFPIATVWRAGLSTQIFLDKKVKTYDLGPMMAFRNKGWYAMLTYFNPWAQNKDYWFFAIQKSIHF